MSYPEAFGALALTLLALRWMWWLFFEPRRRETSQPDPLPRLAARDRSEYVRLRKAMMPDELPMPSTHGIEEVEVDSLWARRN